MGQRKQPSLSGRARRNVSAGLVFPTQVRRGNDEVHLARRGSDEREVPGCVLAVSGTPRGSWAGGMRSIPSVRLS
jgi:hypothetical protein